MIIATAGHVDHGKTSLLESLTGVDADRLPEEKARGLTIDLGFAYTRDLRPGEVTGFVDVPGHEKFIHNMLAGVTAIDAALLVVAADDGVMPQTREHLAILDLVGVGTGIVAITKADAVEDARISAVIDEVGGLLAGTSLEGVPVLPVSSVTGQGIDVLQAAVAAIPACPVQPTGGFRMAIDRAFVIAGAGLVVTGLAQAGRVAVGDTLVVSPGGAKGFEVRVRGLRVQDEPADQAAAADRCAINLAGPAVEKGAIGRGQWLVAPGLQATSRRLDVDLRLLASEAKPLRHWTPVHVHVGTADVPGRVALLEARELLPGDTGVAQLVLDRPVCVCHGDIAIVRDQSAWRTVGGGPVLDHVGPRRGRAAPPRIAQVKAERRADPESALQAALEASPEGVDIPAWARNRNLDAADVAAFDLDGARITPSYAILEQNFSQILTAIPALLSELAADRKSGAASPKDLAAKLPMRPKPAVVESAIDVLLAGGRLERTGAAVRLKDNDRALSGKDVALWKQVSAVLMVDGRPQTVWEVSERVGTGQDDVARFLKRARDVGLVVQVSKNRFMTPADLAQLAAKAEAGLAGLGGDRFTVAHFRDWSGLGRNLSVELLEFFDRAGFTRRAGNERVIRKAAADAFPTGSR